VKLTQRLDGLPLALATAGTYLSQTVNSFGEYLQLYNDRWNDLSQNDTGLLDYEDRTLYSTWNLSLTQIRNQDPAAVELLRLMAYLDNQDLWYELFQNGAKGQPLWWSEVVENRVRFDRAMAILHSYSLIEARPGSYSLHACVHDWTLEYLNRDVNDELCVLAIHCIAQSVKADTEANYWVANRRLLQHAQRLKHTRISRWIGWSSVRPGDLSCVAYLYSHSDMNMEAEEMYVRALRGYEKAWGAEHTLTLETVNNLGVLYADQGKMVEAEEMYIRALRGYDKARGAERTSILNAVHNLGVLYADQGKMVEAMEMYIWALRGQEMIWGAAHTSTLNTVHNLGLLYADQGKMVEAEEMYVRALRGYEKAWGAEHTSTLNTVHNLGLLYADQGKMVEAEEMYVRALRGYEKVLGPEHRSTINTAYNLYVLVREQSWKLKFESDGAVENCFHTVEKVIKILKSLESLPINIWGLLGRNLIWLSDEPNAQVAFQQGIELQDEMLVYTNVLCDGCDLQVTCDMKRFVCQVCQDVDICKHCYDKHKIGKMAISSCTGHAFLEISPEIVSGPSGLHVVGQSERAIWLENLCKQYSLPF
jgi:tetratricopeptide (TPR) repeat protein